MLPKMNSTLSFSRSKLVANLNLEIFKSANDSHDLEESLLASLDRLLYAQLSAPYSALKANLYLLQELTKEITIV